MVSVVISVGSNYGNRREQVVEAIAWLKTILIQSRCSDIYETPCALKRGNPYLNAVIKGFFQSTGEELDSLLKEKEHQMGRTQERRAASEVPIDMDIVIMNNEVVKEWDYRQKFFIQGYTQINN